ncbi:MAG: glycosyltransferase family 4 protein [Prevotellaceae bacterium]|nr:glycosyltransferase family 4 protein [Prevotellaceae bacterium]
MKIAHVFWSLTYGGVQTMLVNIANEQAKAGNDVTVMLINEEYERAVTLELAGNVKLMGMGRKLKSRSPAFLLRLNRTLLKIRPDVIHLHGSLFYGFLLRKELSRVACSTLHALPSGTVRREGLLGKIPLWTAIRHSGNVSLIDKVPKVFAISQAVHDELLEKYGVDSVVVSNGIITGNFRRRNPCLPADTFRIVQVSRLEHEKKGQDLLIRAVAKLPGGKVSVDFIGEGSSMEYLKALAFGLGVSDRARFLGKRPQSYIAEHLCDYDLFVQPSRYEGFGLTVAEAMAARVPVLVSSGQGPAEVCRDDTYGWTFGNGSVDALADRISYILDNYSEALAKAERGRAHVVDTYDVSVTARRYLEEYKR